MTLKRFDPRLAAGLWIALIYVSVPFVRRVREAFAARWPAELIGLGVIVVVAGALLIAVRMLRRRHPRRNLVDIMWLLAVALAAIVWTGHLMGQPEEAVHFVEYGVLGLLLYRALTPRVTDATVFISVTLIGLLVGTIDELIQWLVPGRFWDFRDIVLNGGAVALVQIAIWRLADRPSDPIGASSIRRVCRLAAALVLLLTLCLAATPQRLTWLSNSVRLPQRLANGTDALCEYGFRHAIDDRTAFRSRLSLDELARSDREQAAEVARKLDISRVQRGPSRIRLSPVKDPFAYEVQVHIFARNRNLHRARSQEPGSAEARRFMTSAWREQRILEEVFANTIAQSNFRWGPRTRAEMEAGQDPEARFVSRVGGHLITRLSEGQLRVLLLALFVALVACDFVLATRFRPEAPPE